MLLKKDLDKSGHSGRTSATVTCAPANADKLHAPGVHKCLQDSSK